MSKPFEPKISHILQIQTWYTLRVRSCFNNPEMPKDLVEICARSQNKLFCGFKKSHRTSTTEKLYMIDTIWSQAIQSSGGNQCVSDKAQDVSILQSPFSWL